MTMGVDAPQEIPLAQPAPQLAPVERPITRINQDLPSPQAKAERLASLDVFRGMTIAAMLLVNNPGSWSHMYRPLGHAAWHGWTMTDLIFPFFLFIVGVAIPFSFAKRSVNETRTEMLGHVWARALSLVLLGLLLHSLPSSGLDPIWPSGFTLLGILRVAALFVIPLGFIVLLFPWRSKKLSLLTPPIAAIVLLALGFAIHFATRRAYANGLPDSFSLGGGLFRPSQLRFPGVLQRIGVCYGVAATIALLAGWRTVLFSLVVFLAAYSVLMLKAEFPGHQTGSLTMADNLARSIDVKVFDRPGVKHTYSEYPDPEGLLSTLPAIGSVLLGILVGYSLRATGRTNVEKCARLLASGVFVSIAGVLLSWWLMPVNKKIWTPSYTVLSAGLGMLTLGAVFYLTDVKARRAWAWPFKVYGMNAIAAFVLAGLVARVGTIIRVNDPKSADKTVALLTFCKDGVNQSFQQAGRWWSQALPHLPPLDTPNNASLAWAITYVVVIFVLMWVLYVQRVFIKV